MQIRRNEINKGFQIRISASWRENCALSAFKMSFDIRTAKANAELAELNLKQERKN